MNEGGRPIGRMDVPETRGDGFDVPTNVAGTLVLGSVETVPDELVQRQFEVNVFGLLGITRTFRCRDGQAEGRRVVGVETVNAYARRDH